MRIDSDERIILVDFGDMEGGNSDPRYYLHNFENKVVGWKFSCSSFATDNETAENGFQ